MKKTKLRKGDVVVIADSVWTSMIGEIGIVLWVHGDYVAVMSNWSDVYRPRDLFRLGRL